MLKNLKELFFKYWPYVSTAFLISFILNYFLNWTDIVVDPGDEGSFLELFGVMSFIGQIFFNFYIFKAKTSFFTSLYGRSLYFFINIYWIYHILIGSITLFNNFLNGVFYADIDLLFSAGQYYFNSTMFYRLKPSKKLAKK
jgi:hypothetical protein